MLKHLLPVKEWKAAKAKNDVYALPGFATWRGNLQQVVYRGPCDCPVCGKNLLITDTDKKRLARLGELLRELETKYAAAKTAWNAKNPNQGYWFLGSWRYTSFGHHTREIMTIQTCSACWSPINWCESFNKFGHDDGEDCVHTTLVANALRKAGYYVKVHEDSHNPIVVEIGEEGVPGELSHIYADNLPAGNQPGYTNPRDILPPDVVALLDRIFGTGEFFE